MFGTKQPSDAIQKLTESQEKTYEAVCDISENFSAVLREASEKLAFANGQMDNLMKMTNELLGEVKNVIAKDASLSGRICVLLENEVKILNRVDELNERLTRPPKPIEREEMLPIVTEKIERMFQKLQSHREKPVYSYLIEQRASSLVAMDPQKIRDLPMAQLDSLNSLCDNVLDAMEFCE